MHRLDPAPAIRLTNLMSLRTIAFVGDEQAGAIAALYRTFIASYRDDHVVFYAWEKAFLPEFNSLLPLMDVLCLQDTALLEPLPGGLGDVSGPEIIRFPRLWCKALWPFYQEGEKSQSTGHPTSRWHTDAYLDALIKEGCPPEDALKSYIGLDLACLTELARPVESMFDFYHAVDRNEGYRLAPAIEKEFYDEQLFSSPITPSSRLITILAAQIFERLGVGADQLGRMLDSRLQTQASAVDLPIHPNLAKAIGLRFIGADTRYRFDSSTYLTFREYVEAYLAASNLDSAAGPVRSARQHIGDRMFASPLRPAIDTHQLLNEMRSLKSHDPLTVVSTMGAICSEKPRWSEACELLAEACWAAGDMAGTRDAADQASRSNLDSRSAWRFLGLAERALGNMNEAEQAAVAAVRSDPLSPDAYNLLAELLEDRGQRRAAIDSLECGLKLGVSNAQTFSLLGNFFLRDGSLDRSEEAFAFGARLEPRRIDLRQSLKEVRRLRELNPAD
jgi:tetratricopeptide (TPR) repeat protein